ncbi:MAG TPA: family 1 encapsulin nanocompartment shell protein [Pseudomonadales bacterium]|nr:family 1 encapsulin nanocompartment shell protein [Pseudomonadales bacterium]
MSDLYRELAPITTAGWNAIEEEARGALTTTLAARRLVDFAGPLGWQASSVDLGRTEDLPARADGAMARVRRVQPLIELRIPLTLQRRELDALARGARDADLAPIVTAARTAALAEDGAVFNGDEGAGMVGIMAGAENAPLSLSSDYRAYPEVAAEAVRVLRSQGVAGPYALAMGPRCYAGLTGTTHSGGYPVLDHLESLLDGPLVYAPAVDGSVVMSMRGGDFELTVGRDFSIGYLAHDADTVTLYLESSFTFLNNGPEAAVPLVYASAKRGKQKA